MGGSENKREGSHRMPSLFLFGDSTGFPWCLFQGPGNDFVNILG